MGATAGSLVLTCRPCLMQVEESSTFRAEATWLLQQVLPNYRHTAAACSQAMLGKSREYLHTS